MSKCETCKYFAFTTGYSRAVAHAMGGKLPDKPMCYCRISGKTWEHKGKQIRKPAGMLCAYKEKEGIDRHAYNWIGRNY